MTNCEETGKLLQSIEQMSW